MIIPGQISGQQSPEEKVSKLSHLADPVEALQVRYADLLREREGNS